ncbi:MAG TPA: hypothetical protein EYG80_03265 [Flavobacteriaceae bacterium]|nr:hypothetical protein [Flavobacteriaceae bacterium]
MTSGVVLADTLLSSKTTIKKIFAYRSGAVIELASPMGKNEGCSYAKSGRYVAIRYDNQTKELYSALLSAYVANLTVEIGTKGCDNIWSSVGTMNKLYKLTLSK